MDIHKNIEKLQGLPDKHKKIIMWIIVAVLGFVLLFFWFDSTTKRISNIGEEFKNVGIPQVENK